MHSIRDVLWAYPSYVMRFVRMFSFVFRIVSGFSIGIAIVVLVWFVVSGQSGRWLFGDTLRYGLIGDVTQINPLEFGASDIEQTITNLLYNGLVTIDANGRISPELADTWEVSPDGRTYTFFLKKNVLWHDDVPFTAKDVVTTFQILQSGDKDTVLGEIAKAVECKEINEYEVQFSLSQVNAAFFELMTIGILPDHMYKDFTYARLVDQGDVITPIGTGPYEYMDQKDNVYSFRANAKYFKEVPSIKYVTIEHFDTYPLAEVALLSGKIHALAQLDPMNMVAIQGNVLAGTHLKIQKYSEVNNTRLLLFNLAPSKDRTQPPSVWSAVGMRQLVAKAINKVTLAQEVPGAVAAHGPYNKNSYAYNAEVETVLAYTPEEVRSGLNKLGWVYPYSGALYRMQKEKELGFTLTFLDSPANQKVAQSLKGQLTDVGINITLDGISSDDMQQKVISQQNFEVLLFEIHTGIDPDQYGLWHSSQTTFPGLNLGGYKSSLIDTLLEKGRLQINRDKRLEIYQQFQKELVKDAPAIFLYHPAYYEAYFDVIDRKLPEQVVDPSDRFMNLNTWKLLQRWGDIALIR